MSPQPEEGKEGEREEVSYDILVIVLLLGTSQVVTSSMSPQSEKGKEGEDVSYDVHVVVLLMGIS